MQKTAHFWAFLEGHKFPARIRNLLKISQKVRIRPKNISTKFQVHIPITIFGG
jgi:hypothetical protein